MRIPGGVPSISGKFSVVSCFSSPLVAFENSLHTPPGGVVFIGITLQLCFALVALVAFKNFLTTPPSGVIFSWITIQLCFALEAPRWHLRIL